jgi:GNAT superfamily N-acetyltransferase
MGTHVEFRAGRIDEGDGAALAAAMRAEISQIYGGVDLDAPGLPKAGPAELSPPRGAFLVGYLDDEAVCCGGLKDLGADDACEIKRMYVAPAARGKGVARALLAALEDEARRLGYRLARLDTGDRQPDALHLYTSAGYCDIENFNGNPVASWFGERTL